MNGLLDRLIRRWRNLEPHAPSIDTIRQGSQNWPAAVEAANQLNVAGIRLLVQARRYVEAIYGGNYPKTDSIIAQERLQKDIADILTRYSNDETAYKYFFGHPYQGLAIANVFGDRLCDYRFDDYDLRKFIKSSDRVLDIGCNCGFMAILASYRTGCFSEGIDINPYMIEIGERVADYLRVSDTISLHAGRLQDFAPMEPFDVVMSFATHWTDDNNYRVSIEDHMQKMAHYLKPQATLIFETHCNDVGKTDFYAAMDRVRGSIFEFEGFYKLTDSNTRELYIMKKV